MKEFLDNAVLFINKYPFIRDFGEGLISAAIGGAAGAILAATASTAGPTTAEAVVTGAVTGAVAAIIAYARHRLEDSIKPA